MSARRTMVASGVASVLVAASAVAVSVVASAPAAQAVFGNVGGGSGRYQTAIDWIDWSDTFGTARTASASSDNKTSTGPVRTVLAGEGNQVNWSTPTDIGEGYWRSSRCTVAVTSGSGGQYWQGNPNKPGVFAYAPGGYRGDGLARLYNDGTNYSNGSQIPGAASFDSGLRIGLANYAYGTGGTGGTANSATVNFTVSCDTYLFPSEQRPVLTATTKPTDLNAVQLPMAGMVVADAESNNSYESLSAAPINDSAQWHLLESVKSSTCPSKANSVARPWTSTDHHTGFSFTSSGNQCSTDTQADNTGYGPGSVTFMEGATAVSSQLVGNGRSAMAFGVVTYMDFGDAPRTYGLAGAVYQPTWSGGIIPPKGDDLTSMSTGGNVGVARSPQPILGTTIDAERAPYYSDNAMGDDTHDSNGASTTQSDEDGVVPPQSGYRTQPGGTVTQDVTCSGTGKIAAWIDWNRNGVFDEDEGSITQPTCTGGKATVSWTVPQDVSPGKTFLRVRISNDGATLTPTGVTLSGEVEDYQVAVYVPTLTLVKDVDSTYADPALDKTQWTLNATRSGVTIGGPGGMQSKVVTPGAYTLAESSTNPAAQGYSAGDWVCTATTPDSTPGASKLVGTTITVANQDNVTCTIKNTARPGKLVITKKDATDKLVLAGAKFQLWKDVNGDSRGGHPRSGPSNIRIAGATVGNVTYNCCVHCRIIET